MCYVRFSCRLQALVFLFFFAIAQIAAAAGAVAPPFSLKVGVPPDLPPVLRQHAQRMVQALSDDSDGRLSAQIVTMEDTGPCVHKDDAPQICFVNLDFYRHYESLDESIFNTIFGFEDLRAVERFLDSNAGKLAFDVADKNKRLTLTYWHGGMMQLVAGTGGESLADSGVPNKDNRVALHPDGPPGWGPQFSSVGFKNDSGRHDRRFERLAVGAVDYVEAGWDEIIAAAGPRSLLNGSTVIVTNHSYVGYLLVADPMWFAALPQEVRALLLKKAQDKSRRYNALIEAKEMANARRFAARSAIHSVPMQLEARAMILRTLQDRMARGFLDDGFSPPFLKSTPSWPLGVVVTGSRDRVSTSPAQKENAVAAWRTWLEDREGEVSVAEVGREYWLNLTLSRRGARSLIDAGPALKAAIDDAVRERKKFLPLSIRPVALSGGLQLLAGNTRVEFPVQLNRLETRSEDEEEKELEAREDKNIAGEPERKIAELFDAAVLSVKVKANPGVACAQVLFSVWDEEGIVPVDMLVATIQISQDGPGEACSPRLQGGFGSLLGVAESMPRPDAGLSLFEYVDAGEMRTVAMLVSGAAYERSVAAQPILERGVHVWFLDRQLSEFIDSDLPAAVVAARSSGHYEVPGDHLARTLFPQANPQAKKALEALQDIVARKETSAWINVRSAKTNGKYFYPPLALLAAKGGALQKRPMFVYPLPTARRQGESCIGLWKAVIPEKLDGEVVAVEGIDLPGRMEAIRKIESFRTFLSNTPTPGDVGMSGQRPATEGLLLLAHHDNGNLWFSDNGTKDKVLPTENNRIFAKGSAAILNACHTASGVGYNQDLIEKFNRNGMDAMLVTPFAMDKEYGEHFSREMVKAIHRVYNDGKGVTLAALMDVVAQEVMNDPTAGKDAQRMLEMVFVGNPSVRLCDKP